MKKENVEYSVSDLARALLRQFLTERGLKNTLLCFEKEDVNNKKRINKNLLIEMISLKSLFIQNKQSSIIQPTLLEILVSYLNKKYKAKNNNFMLTQPSQPKSSYPKLFDSLEEKKIQTRNKLKQRPSSASGKPFKSNNIESLKQKLAHPLQKQELRTIYKKLDQVQPSELNKRKYQNNEAKNYVIQKQYPKNNINTTLPNPLPIPNLIEVQEEYLQTFEEEYNQKHNKNELKVQPIKGVKQYRRPSAKQQKTSEKAIESVKTINKINKQQHLNECKQILPTSPINYHYQDNLIQKKQNKLQQIEKQKVQLIQEKQLQNRLQYNNSQSNLNPTPILHMISSTQKEHSNHTEEAKLITSAEVVIYQRPNQEVLTKNRTQMRILGKAKQETKIEEVFDKCKIKEITQQTCKQQIKIEQNVHMRNEQIKCQQQMEIKANMGNKQAPKVMMAIKKKKNKQQGNDVSYPTKFKFDDNFTHEIPKEMAYQYTPYTFQTIVIDQKASEKYPWLIIDPPINYKQKGGDIAPIKKKPQKIITPKEADRLRKIVFQSASSVLPKSWTQGFILSPHEITPYGLKQIEGGPCGIIAAVQCYFLKHLLLCSKQSVYNDQTLRQVALVAAITDILWKLKSDNKFILAFPPKGVTKVQISNLRTLVVDANDFANAFAGIWSVREEYLGNTNHGVVALLYSTILTKGIEVIQSQMDIKENPLIGNHGHCTQQFVNMLLTGKASSNCFDGEKVIDDYKIKGICEKSQFGFLTIFQTLKFIQVGKNLKNPVFPVWVICKQFHYHVIFAPHHLIGENNKTSKFDIVYFDGLYNCGDRIRLTVEDKKLDEDEVKLKDLPLIEQVMMTKWGRRTVDWNGSIKIL